MNHKTMILTLTIMLYLSLSFSAIGQQTETWIIPPDAPSHITSGYLDSLNIIPADPANPPGFGISQDSIGKPMWLSETFVKNYSNNKEKATLYICGEKYWVKTEAQRDTITNVIEYKTATTSQDSTGSEFWTEGIDVDVVDNTELIINSPVDVKARLYEAYDVINPTFTELSVTGSGLDQSYTVNMQNGVTYIIVFIENENTLVDAKRIGGQ